MNLKRVSGNRKPLAMATATLVVQGDPSAEKFSATGFEHAIDKVTSLRRVQAVETRQADEAAELRCRVEFGPDRGSAGDVERHLHRALGILAPGLDALDYEVFDVVVTPLKTAADINARIDKLTGDIDDAGTSLAIRKRSENVVARLKKEAASLPEVRHA